MQLISQGMRLTCRECHQLAERLFNNRIMLLMTRGLYKKKVLVIPPRVPGAKVMTPEIINAQIRAANPDAPLLPSKPPDSTVTAQIKAAAEAVERARNGEGPSAIECYAKRWYGHFEGDPQHYRTKEELESIRENNDPLIIFRQKVEEAGLVDGNDLDEIDIDLSKQVLAAVEKAKNSPLPDINELTTNVYEKGSY